MAYETIHEETTDFDGVTCYIKRGVIVRCKDCEHMEITPDNLRWCNAWNSINGMGDEGYCNYGERRCE